MGANLFRRLACRHCSRELVLCRCTCASRMRDNSPLICSPCAAASLQNLRRCYRSYRQAVPRLSTSNPFLASTQGIHWMVLDYGKEGGTEQVCTGWHFVDSNPNHTQIPSSSPGPTRVPSESSPFVLVCAQFASLTQFLCGRPFEAASESTSRGSLTCERSSWTMRGRL